MQNFRWNPFSFRLTNVLQTFPEFPFCSSIVFPSWSSMNFVLTGHELHLECRQTGSIKSFQEDSVKSWLWPDLPALHRTDNKNIRMFSEKILCSLALLWLCSELLHELLCVVYFQFTSHLSTSLSASSWRWSGWSPSVTPRNCSASSTIRPFPPGQSLRLCAVTFFILFFTHNDAFVLCSSQGLGVWQHVRELAEGGRLREYPGLCPWI